MITKMLPMIISLLLATAACGHVHHAVETEMFAIPISPNLFNWTYQEFDQQYRFHASLQGKPELPSWLRYIYSGRHHSGFIFGTPPRGIPTPITLEVIGLNRQDYETRRVLLTLVVHQKQNMARHEVELKIDNLNVEDLLDEHKMTRLKDILRTKLWVESSEDLYATFLASAIDLGARLPLKPSDGEGLVIRLGSTKPFSAELKRLREEVRPLSRLPSCPRDYKRTTVERWFRDAGLTLDWCNFELYNTIYTERSTKQLEYLIELPNSKSSMSSKAIDSGGQWHAPARRSLPSRSYSAPLTVALLLPTVLLLSVAAITALVCCHYPAIRDPESENFLDNIFHICDEYRQRRAQRPANACRYGTDNTEQTHVADNVSAKSLGVSPNNSLVRPYSPKSTTNMSGDYNRPLPPPYLGSVTTALHHRKANNSTTPSTTSHTPEHTRTHLEESLKLLNDAKICNEFDIPILNEPIMDIDHGNGDYVPANLDKTGYMPVNPDNTGYVPVKPDKIGYVAIKSDLDDIGVPDLAKFGIRGPM